ncbi:MAG TPA: phenylalanine--tRNA ligase subunit beta [Gaiellaceae bacterium]|nr:phenylalanine--tRNA ligase subunit beta [Gaiellaceae bacterium]
MKVPVSWLREYVAYDLPLEELARRLVFTSCEVDRIVRRGVPDVDGNLGRFRVARVLEAVKHPNADRLQLCRVDVGEGEPLQIVCGAWNFGAGATVAVALPGAVLPNGVQLERRKVRGEYSNGMILAEDEVDLGTDHTGIMLLDPSHAPGTPLADVLPLTDDVLEIETGYNRPDLTSIYGIAREVAALTGAELAPPPGSEPERAGDEPVDVRIDDLERCPRYIGRLFRDVAVGDSPAWMRARLLGAGMRPISNVVDVTNYVMLALGSPLHAFDHAKLAEGRIVVRRAGDGEEIRTLDGTVRALTPDDLVIADAERPVAIAGIMGGEDSEVSAETETVLLEAANFEQLGVLKSGERLHMRSEAQTRWEKGVAPELAEAAAVYATQLLVELAGARWVGHTDVEADLPARPTIRLHPERAEHVIGIPIPEAEQRERLARLGFDVGGELDVGVPAWRARDVRREIDLVEEVARFRLEDVPATLPARREMFGRLTREQRLRRAVGDVLVGQGFFEAYTYSLQPEDPHPDALVLPEPLSELQRVLRTTLLHGLLGAARLNVNSGNEEVALFEVAHVYLPSGGQLPDERWHVAGVVRGGYFRAKGAVETLLEALEIEPRFTAAAHPFMPAPACAETDGGWVAQLDPRLLDGEWGAFELDLDELFTRVPERILYRDVVTFPPVREDLAFTVAEEVPAGELAAAAREAAGPELCEIRVFDVYRGPQVGDGRKSVAFAVTYQSAERTLSDEDAARLRGAIVAELARRFGAELRA